MIQKTTVKIGTPNNSYKNMLADSKIHLSAPVLDSQNLRSCRPRDTTFLSAPWVSALTGVNYELAVIRAIF